MLPTEVVASIFEDVQSPRGRSHEEPAPGGGPALSTGWAGPSPEVLAHLTELIQSQHQCHLVQYLDSSLRIPEIVGN